MRDGTVLMVLIDISIHTLRVEGDTQATLLFSPCFDISIHTLRVEGDVNTFFMPFVIFLFQSTPSVWRVTAFARILFKTSIISIHTLRVEGDPSSSFVF